MSLIAEALVETERSSRYLVQLCRHAKEMGQHLRDQSRTHEGGDAPPEVQHVEWSDTYGKVQLGFGQYTLLATPDSLALRVEATDQENLRRLQDLLAKRLETFGRRDHLKVIWQAPAVQLGEAASTAPMATEKAEARRGHLKTIILIAAGALALAMHLGLGGAMLANSQWITWTAYAMLAIIAVKVIVVTVIGLRRRATRRGKVPISDEP